VFKTLKTLPKEKKNACGIKKKEEEEVQIIQTNEVIFQNSQEWNLIDPLEH